MIQAGGGALELSDGKQNLGKNIFLAGIALQSASYYIFVALVIYTHIKVKRASAFSGRESWWTVLYVLYVASAFIVVSLPLFFRPFCSTFPKIRTVYRLIEGIGGRNGRLSTHEGMYGTCAAVASFMLIHFYSLFLRARRSSPSYCPWSLDTLVPRELH